LSFMVSCCCCCYCCYCLCYCLYLQMAQKWHRDSTYGSWFGSWRSCCGRSNQLFRTVLAHAVVVAQCAPLCPGRAMLLLMMPPS
jgi:hypothetical protein